jgi:hypothetical protein
MDQEVAQRAPWVSGWLSRRSDHTVLIIATILPLILAVIAFALGDSNGYSLAGWFAGSLLSFYLAWMVWERTRSQTTRALALVVVGLWLVFDAATLIRIIVD